MNLAQNPLYIVAYSGSITLYQPAETHEYHLSRYIAAGAQNIYSSCGITPELLGAFMDEMIRQANDEKMSQLRTNIGVLANNIKYRLKHPVDEECAIRMGAIYTFMENENPDECSNTFTVAKIQAAKKDPALYDFFLNMGKRLTPSWNAYEQDLTDTEYSAKRQSDLDQLSPQ